MTTVSVGPVAADAVEAWTANTLDILHALATHPEKVPFRIPGEALGEMRSLVEQWRGGGRQSKAGEQVTWSGEFETNTLQLLLVYWFNITQLTEDDKARLGIEFSPPVAQPFGEALAASVGEAVGADPSLVEFARRLAVQWNECQPAFNAALANP